MAGVFVNRLAKNMLLQTDPTVIYGLGDSFDGNLRRTHLEDPKNPYNTYQHPGLPLAPSVPRGWTRFWPWPPGNPRLLLFRGHGRGRAPLQQDLKRPHQRRDRFQRKRASSP